MAKVKSISIVKLLAVLENMRMDENATSDDKIFSKVQCKTWALREYLKKARGYNECIEDIKKVLTQ